MRATSMRSRVCPLTHSLHCQLLALELVAQLLLLRAQLLLLRAQPLQLRGVLLPELAAHRTGIARLLGCHDLRLHSSDLPFHDSDALLDNGQLLCKRRIGECSSGPC